MNINKHSAMLRIATVILIFSLVLPLAVSASGIESRASAYLDSYGAYVYLPGDGEVRVYFNVQGTGMMDELGVLRIELYESTDGINWTGVKVFKHYTTAGMLSYNDDYHSGHVSYSGVAGRYYKAYICVWGGKDGAGDTRYFWTSMKH